MKCNRIALGILVCLLACTGLAAQETALSEGFEGTFPPAGWGIYQTIDTGDPNWAQTADQAHEGTYSAMHDYGLALSENWLVMPVDLTLASEAMLTFWEYQEFGFAIGEHAVLVTTDPNPDPGSAVYDSAWIDLVGPGTTWTQQTVGLNDWVGQQIYVAFTYRGEDADTWYIDDVEVTYFPCVFPGKFRLQDSCGDAPPIDATGDRVIDPGETVTIQSSVFNGCEVDLENVWVRLESAHPCVEVTDGVAYIGDVGGGDPPPYDLAFKVAPQECCDFQCGDEFTLLVTVEGDTVPGPSKQHFLFTYEYQYQFGYTEMSMETVFEDDFDPFPPEAVPAGWTTVVVDFPNGATPPEWIWWDETHQPDTQGPYSGDGLVYLNSGHTSAGNSARFYHTDPVDLSGYVGADLTFWMFHENGMPGHDDRLQAQVSTDGGANWIDVGDPKSRYASSDGYWGNHLVDISAFAGQAIHLGFLGISGNGNDVHIDSVRVEGIIEIICEWDPCELDNDMALTKRVGGGGEVAGLPVTFNLKVGNVSEGVGHQVYVDDILPEGLEFVECTTTVGDCDYDEGSRTVTIDIGTACPGDPAVDITITAIPMVGGDYVNEACVAEGVLEDTNPDNDCDTAEFSIAAFTHTFIDDHGRAWCCVNQYTGGWEWTAQDPRLGLFVLGGDGFITWRAGIMYVQALAGTPWVMALKYNQRYHRAWGYFQYLQYRIKSGLYDLSTLNNPPICDVPEVDPPGAKSAH